MSSAIAKLTLRMMPLASVLDFGTSLYLIKEQLYCTRSMDVTSTPLRMGTVQSISSRSQSTRNRSRDDGGSASGSGTSSTMKVSRDGIDDIRWTGDVRNIESPYAHCLLAHRDPQRSDNHIEGSSSERYSQWHRRYNHGRQSPMRRRRCHYTAVLICMQTTVWSCCSMTRIR